MHFMFVTRVSVITAFLAAFCLNACSMVRVNAIPPPPPTAKLRVFVQVVSEEPRSRSYRYGVPSEEWAEGVTMAADRYLRDTGIYEVVPKEDTKAVLGQRGPTSEQYWWVKKDYTLLRQAGKALYAEYAIIIVRTFVSNIAYKMILINLETGAKYEASGAIPFARFGERGRKFGAQLIQTMYRKLFYDAKGDLLATAIRKGRLMPEQEVMKPPPVEIKVALTPPPAPPVAPAPPERAVEKKPAPIAEQPQEPVLVPVTKKEESSQPMETPAKPVLQTPPVREEKPAPKPAPMVKAEVAKEPVKPKAPIEEPVPQVVAKVVPPSKPEVSADDKRKEFENKLEKELQTGEPAKDKTKVVVYDFDAIERMRVVALILTDALREELFILGRFSLVNRENMVQVMEEMKLQHSGLVDEKQAVELGKWLAANQAVTGRLAALGNSYVLQAKRTDIKTMGTLGLGMLKCASGQEEDLLSGIPALARKLAGMKSDAQ
ncbi:MAG TPA: CsgG/HfaB family protein [Syntrophales bacterium]|nr:CsgG/HfaB family protein [Syntrophales bacterium]